MSEINYNIDIPYKKYIVTILNKNVDKYIRKDCNKSDRDVEFFIIQKLYKEYSTAIIVGTDFAPSYYTGMIQSDLF